MWNGLLPIGSVVQLQDGEVPVMIVGLCQTSPSAGDDTEEIYDYVGVPYPIGYMSADEMLQFDHDAIERIFAVGFMNEDMLEYMPGIQEIMDGLRDGSITPQELRASLEEDDEDGEDGDAEDTRADQTEDGEDNGQ